MTSLAPHFAVLLLAAAAAQPAPAQQLDGPFAGSLGKVQEDAHAVFTAFLSDAGLWLSHPKDKGVQRALSMLDDRLLDLPVELGTAFPRDLGLAVSPEVMPIWLRVLQAPKSLSIGVSSALMESTGSPLALGVAMHESDADAAAALYGQISSVAQTLGMPIPDGLIQVEESSLVLRAGLEPSVPGESLAAPFLGGRTLIEEVTIDVGAIVRFASELVPGQAGPMDGVARQLGLHRLKIHVATGAGDAGFRSVSVATNLAKAARDAGILPEAGLTPNHLSIIPADATLAIVQRVDLGAAFEAINSLAGSVMAQQGMGADADLGDMVKSTTGIDLRTSLFGALGQTVGFYTSETTGGGGLSSMVVFAEVADVDGLTDTKETIQELVNALSMGWTRGYASLRTWDEGDVEYTTLMFPGIPVPLELTMGMNEEWLVIGASPTAARGALQHAQSGGASLATQPEVEAALGGGTRSAISFVDTAHFARSGYGTASMLASSLANAVRSPIDTTRNPGPIMPTFHELMEGIRPTVGYTEVRGDDLVTISDGDSSVLVGIASGCGLLGEFSPLLVAPILGTVAGLPLTDFRF